MPRQLERLPHFRFHCADYLIDTAGLTQAQHGAYALLMVHYYWEGRLPHELQALYSLARAQDDASRSATDLVIARYFHRDESGSLVHYRIERELQKIRETMAKRSGAGLRSAEVRSAKKTIAKTKKGNGADDNDAGFDLFWDLYPRKVAKPAALKQWRSLHPDEQTRARIMQSLHTHKTNPQWQADGLKYVPHPATWLNQRRWEDEAPKQSEQAFPI